MNSKIDWKSRICPIDVDDDDDICLLNFSLISNKNNWKAFFYLFLLIIYISCLISSSIIFVISIDKVFKEYKSFGFVTLKNILMLSLSGIFGILLFIITKVIIYKEKKKNKKNFFLCQSQNCEITFQIKKNFLVEYFEEYKSKFKNIKSINEVTSSELTNEQWFFLKKTILLYNPSYKRKIFSDKTVLLKDINYNLFKIENYNGEINHFLIWNRFDLTFFYKEKNDEKKDINFPDWLLAEKIKIKKIEFVSFNYKTLKKQNHLYKIETIYSESEIKKFVINQTYIFLKFIDNIIEHYTL
ncbi:hypothetical protein [Mesomycoplasma neurolyticum]|uniref:Uncharacterized protein n=1 Tax=Mesomycoplasma neurolyticum TaxID=2120 RepID=A0A449A6G8_9BACT|nr:hypothetical protein [Mesomycoplasma neurolyticum]VEU59828.1 Uncharacterised protein [Mesomycoplasma neurolyticum]